MPASSQVLDPIRVSFDDERAVADAGLMLTGTLIGRLGLERTIDAKVSRGYRPGRKLLTVVSMLLAGGAKLAMVSATAVRQRSPSRWPAQSLKCLK